MVSGWSWEKKGPRAYTAHMEIRGERSEVVVPNGQKENEGDGGDAHLALTGKVDVYPTGSKARKDSNGTGRRKDVLTSAPDEVPSKYDFALAFLFGTRGINKPWQSKNVAPFSLNYSALPPTRPQFLSRRSLTVVLAFLTIDIGTFHPLDPKLFDLATIPVLARLPLGFASDEIISRTINTVVNWIINYAFICFFANCWACLVVLSGLSVPEAWPPGFAALADAWTLRRFWG